MNYSTKLIHSGMDRDPYTGASSIPIYQTSTFAQPDPEHPGAYDYARSGNPTREALERLANGLVIQGHRTLPCRARQLDHDAGAVATRCEPHRRVRGPADSARDRRGALPDLRLRL